MEFRGKKTKIQQESNDLDRLSCLPDSILAHIFSFLDTKSVISTSFLSKRYRILWTQSPSLDFKSSDFDTGKSSGSSSTRGGGDSLEFDPFVSFVDNVFQRREPIVLTAFRLSLHSSVALEFLQNCVNYAAEHKVQHLRLRVCCKDEFVMWPKLLLTSSSLTTLSLHNTTAKSIELPSSACWPNLKVLRLKSFEFLETERRWELLSGCPSLETLVLSKCWIRPRVGPKVLDVHCPNLRNLEIKHWRSPWDCFNKYLINVCAPNLAFFKFQGYLARMDFNEGFLCLDKACIDLCYPTSCLMINADERKQKTSEGFLGMLHHMRNVKSLSLSSKTIEVLSALPDLQLRAPTTFENLKIMRFTAEEKYTETTIPIQTLVQLLERVIDDVMILGISKGGHKLLLECSKMKAKHKNARSITLPANALRFLLDCSPAVEFLSIEIPKKSSD